MGRSYRAIEASRSIGSKMIAKLADVPDTLSDIHSRPGSAREREYRLVLPLLKTP